MTAKAKHLMFVMFLDGFSIRLDKALHILKQSPMMLLGDDNDKRLILSFFKDVKEEFSLAAEILVEEGSIEERPTILLIENLLPEIDKAALKTIKAIKVRTAEEDFQYETLNQLYYEKHM